mgnify:CR=1 FL=1
MEETRKRALKLADIIAASEELSSKVIHEATQELNEHLKKLDSQTQKEVMERIRGYS